MRHTETEGASIRTEEPVPSRETPSSKNVKGHVSTSNSVGGTPYPQTGAVAYFPRGPGVAS